MDKRVPAEDGHRNRSLFQTRLRIQNFAPSVSDPSRHFRRAIEPSLAVFVFAVQPSFSVDAKIVFVEVPEQIMPGGAAVAVTQLKGTLVFRAGGCPLTRRVRAAGAPGAAAIADQGLVVSCHRCGGAHDIVVGGQSLTAQGYFSAQRKGNATPLTLQTLQKSGGPGTQRAGDGVWWTVAVSSQCRGFPLQGSHSIRRVHDRFGREIQRGP